MRRYGEWEAPTASRGRHNRIGANRFGWTARMHDVFETYLHALREDRDDKTELSDRGVLERS
jgi:hypothetical protein